MASLESVRELLNCDRFWTAYALGDLDARRAHFCTWYVKQDSLVLLYREFENPILFACGPDPSILDCVEHSGPCFLQIPFHFREAVEERFALDWTRPMRRMGLQPAEFRNDQRNTQNRPSLLTAVDEPAMRELYADGIEVHEEPDFFMSNQLRDATFYGIRENGQLIAAGGTHLYCDSESIATIGNVYTHRQHRGRGHARAVTSAIVQNLLERDIQTIVLNVKSQNSAAIRIYEQLGFHFHCDYWEGFASMRKI